MNAFRMKQFESPEQEFLHHVNEALKGDHNDLRREQIILRAYRSALSQALEPILLMPERVHEGSYNIGYNAALEKARSYASDALNARPLANSGDETPPPSSEQSPKSPSQKAST